MENLKVIKIEAVEITTREAKNTYRCELHITCSFNNGDKQVYKYYTFNAPKLNIPRKTSVKRKVSIEEFKRNRDKWNYKENICRVNPSAWYELLLFEDAHIPKVIQKLEEHYSDRDYHSDEVQKLEKEALEKYGVTERDAFVYKFIKNTDRYKNLERNLRQAEEERREYIKMVDSLVVKALNQLI